MALHAVSPAAAASPPCALSSARLPQRPGCGCLSNRSSLLSSSTNFMKFQSGAVGFFGVPLVLQHSDKRAVLRHATNEEIEEEKMIVEEQAVEYYGTPVNLKTIAQINTPDATSLLIQPYDKSCLKLIEKAIVAANIGVTPSNDGEVIRVTVPPLTSDRRKEMTKNVAKLSEEGKVAIRNIRRDAIKAYDKLEKEKKLSEDNVKDLSADLQKITDEYMKKVEAIQKQKEQELSKV
ncbi:hypothetical protein CFC21_022827 [Triticum aestivum]|uniref:Ribosome-recycling factor, chloroplastic n=3 Tax=Triticum TaxID=4564 RepID=A0A9R1PJR1_TRITD|nr:hypothetical protein CFC21_022827 [Triticum aestivum]VAH44592.1 unnamed protein product [Triticum turgidum subsp. durum]